MPGKWRIRIRKLTIVAGLCVGLGGVFLRAQSAPPPTPPAGTEKGDAKPDSSAAQPGGGSQNAFPGEDPNVPIIPVDPGAVNSAPGNPDSGAGSGADSGSGAEPASSARRSDDPSGDPVRSPDAPATGGSDDGFTSSRTGLSQMPAEDDRDGKPGKSTKDKTRGQVIQEDLDVGNFYLERKNWKAAQARFAAAFALDGENPDAVLGLAEAERHLDLYKEANEHYKLFLSYDPDGPHSRAARKAMEDVQAALPKTQ